VGNARVGVEVDDIFITEWVSQYLDPRKSEVGYVSIGRLSKGQHTVLAYVNPGSGGCLTTTQIHLTWSEPINRKEGSPIKRPFLTSFLGAEDKKAFTNIDELWDILNPQKKVKPDSGRERRKIADKAAS
jgi:hypothetical protein